MQFAQAGVRRYSSEVVSHSHSHHQIVLGLHGSLEMEIGGRGGRVGADTAALIASNTPHSFCAAPDGRFLVLDLPGGRASGRALWENGRVMPFLELEPDDRQLCGWLARRAGTDGADGMLALHATALLVDLIEERLGLARDAALPAPLLRAMSWVDTNLGRAVGLADMASAAGRSASRLLPLFRQHLGMSPGEYLLSRRMAFAGRLLGTTRLPVGEIAARVGYDDPSAFARAFRRATGSSPRAFRSRAASTVD